MSHREPIPSTPLLARLRGLPSSRRARLALAEQLAHDSAPLVADMLDSVRLLADLDRGEEDFCGPRPELVCDLAEIAHRQRGVRTADFAFWLARRGQLTVTLEPQLDCSYVDREVVPIRGRRGACLSDGGRAAPLRLDLLLVNANATDRTPVVAEVKIARDKDPFAGLVQALAGLVQLATPAQYRRLRGAYPRAGFPERHRPPPLDAYVLCVDPAWETPLMGELLVAARQVARNLSGARQTATIMRRATLLALPRRPGELWSEALRL
jgi:hypothetical protein